MGMSGVHTARAAEPANILCCVRKKPQKNSPTACIPPNLRSGNWESKKTGHRKGTPENGFTNKEWILGKEINALHILNHKTWNNTTLINSSPCHNTAKSPRTLPGPCAPPKAAAGMPTAAGHLKTRMNFVCYPPRVDERKKYKLSPHSVKNEHQTELWNIMQLFQVAWFEISFLQKKLRLFQKKRKLKMQINFVPN